LSCAEFKIPDHLAHGPLSAAEIAAKIGSEGKYVERVMFACAANGIFQLAKSEPGIKEPRFVNTALSAVLREDHPNSMRAMVGHNAEDVFASWGRLADFIANPKGPIAHDLAFPEYPFAKGGIWNKFEKNPASEAQFGKAMTSIDGIGANAMVADGPWAKFKRVVDVGGGRGHFLHRILSAHPSLSGVVLDRPPVIELAKKAFGSGGEFASAAGRVELQGGSFFEAADIPRAQDGDAFYMRYILHDWPTKETLTILKNVRAAMGGTNSTLLIGECALPDHDQVGVPPVMYQIDIQVRKRAFAGLGASPPCQSASSQVAAHSLTSRTCSLVLLHISPCVARR
jgi:hypothetical protein